MNYQSHVYDTWCKTIKNEKEKNKENIFMFFLLSIKHEKHKIDIEMGARGVGDVGLVERYWEWDWM